MNSLNESLEQNIQKLEELNEKATQMTQKKIDYEYNLLKGR